MGPNTILKSDGFRSYPSMSRLRGAIDDFHTQSFLG